MRQFLFLVTTLLLSVPVLAKEKKATVKGMVCAFCAQGITKKFKALPEVESIDVSLEKKTVVVKTKDNKDISNDVIKKILTDSGYTVEGDIK